MSKKAVNIFLLVFSQAINFIILFLFTPYLVRALPKAVYGSYSQTLFITEFINVLTSMAIVQVAMMIFSNKNYSLLDSLKTTIYFTFGAGLVGAVLCYLFSFWAPSLFDNSDLRLMLQIYGISIIGNRLNQVLNQALIRIEKAKSIMYISIIANFIKLILAVIAIRVYDSIWFMLLIYALEPIISSFIQLIILKRSNYLEGKYNFEIIRSIFHIGAPLYIVEILGASYTYISGMYISYFLNQESYAVYKNGSIELPVIGTLYGTISIIFMTDMMRHIQEKDYIKVATKKREIISATAVLLYPVAIFFIFYSKDFILLYYSQKYFESYKIFIVFTIILFIRIQNYTDVLVMLQKSKYVMYSFLVFLLVNLSSNFILMRYFDILGSAIATALSVLILAWMQLHITIKQLQVKYSDYINLITLAKITSISALAIFLFKYCSQWVHLNGVISMILAGALLVPGLILLFIKMKFIEISHFEKLFEKIPIFGSKLYRMLC